MARKQRDPDAADVRALIEEVTRLRQQVASLTAHIDAKDATIPDRVRQQLDPDHPGFAREAERRARDMRRHIEADMVEYTPTRTTVVGIEGNFYRVQAGVPCRVPRAVVTVLEQSEQHMADAEKLSQALQAQLHGVPAMRVVNEQGEVARC